MNFKNLNDKKLDLIAVTQAKNIHKETYKLLEILMEVNKRKSYADHGYSSLFYYITKYLNFSSAQAGVYNSIVQSKVMRLKSATDMLEKGEVSLSSLSLLGNIIRNSEEKIPPKKQEDLLQKIKNKTKEEAKLELSNEFKLKEPPKRVNLKINAKLNSNLQKIKKKLGTPHMSDESVLEYLVNKELHQGKEIKTNKSITDKTRAVLLHRADHRCQFKNDKGERCQATKYLEVEHKIPRAKGGGNKPQNLMILCRAHNQRNAVKEFGVFQGANYL